MRRPKAYNYEELPVGTRIYWRGETNAPGIVISKGGGRG